MVRPIRLNDVDDDARDAPKEEIDDDDGFGLQQMRIFLLLLFNIE